MSQREPGGDQTARGATSAPNFPEIPGCRILALAGQGGMGTVYRAEQATPRRIVAVKVLNQAAASPDKLLAFHREAETIARLEHPHILPIYGYGEVNGRPYLVLRYLGGGNLATRIRRGPLPLADAARWVKDVAAALDFAHAHGVLHRDVKPSNMLLDEAGNAYLTDFGIAAAAEATATGPATGSANYMSPEQASGLPADRRSDVYALAASLYEMLTGQPPYTAETPLGVIVRHINDPVPSARAANAGLSPAVDAVIQRGMAKAPAARPQTAGELARLLEQAIAAPVAEPSPTLLAPEPAAVAAAVPRGPTTLLWVGLGLLAVCLVGGLALGGGGALLAMTNAARSTATPVPTRTPPPTLTPAPMPPGQLLADDFSDPNSGFGIPPADTSGGVAYVGGALRISVLKQGVEWFSTSGRVSAQDVKLKVDAQQTSGPALTEFGVVCRWQDANNYTAFALSAAGQYKIWQKTNGKTQRLVDWTNAPAPAGAPNAPHLLSVTCDSAQLSLTDNGQLLGQAQDPHPARGDVALFAGLRQDGKLVVEFQKIVVVQP